MKKIGKPVLCLLSSLALGGSAEALTPDNGSNPYKTIAVRNAFNLHAPPPQTGPPPVKAILPKVTVLGMTDILGKELAILRLALPAGPQNQAKEQVLTMTKGERQGEIEVLDIDAKAGSIILNNYGTVEVKTIEKDGAKAPSVPAVAPPLGVQPPVRPATDQPMTPEEQIILMEVQRELNKSKGRSSAPPLPPTPLTPTSR